MRALIAIAMLVTAFPASAYDVAGWSLSPYPVEAPTGCGMFGSEQEGTRLGVIVSRNYEWWLGLHNPSWHSTPGAVTTIAAFVDNKFLVRGRAISVTNTEAVIAVQGTAAYRALQDGDQLRLETPKAVLTFRLTGSALAMAALLECVKGLDQVKPPAVATTPDFQVVPAAESTVMLTNLLNAAGIHDYRLGPPNGDTQVVSFMFSDGSQGIFAAARGRDTKDADEYAGYVIATISRDCKGEFLTGKQSVPSVDGSIIRKIAVTCRTPQQSKIGEILVIRRVNGLLMSLAQTAAATPLGDNSSQGATQRERSGLIEASMISQDFK
jgi:hypothetical protein